MALRRCHNYLILSACHSWSLPGFPAPPTVGWPVCRSAHLSQAGSSRSGVLLWALTSLGTRGTKEQTRVSLGRPMVPLTGVLWDGTLSPWADMSPRKVPRLT